MKQTWWAGHHSLEVGPPIPRYTLFSTLSFHCICILEVGPTNTHYYLVFRYIVFSYVLKETPLLRGGPLLLRCAFFLKCNFLLLESFLSQNSVLLSSYV